MKYKLWQNRVILLNYDSFQSMWIMYNYIVDWEEFKLISIYLQPGDEVFDIGANMGFYTIWMSRFIAGGKIHSFEPDSTSFGNLQRNIELNNLQTTIIANKKAASHVEGELNFTVGLDGENHIVETPSKNSVTIRSTTIDNYIAKHNISNITYMKIDVEGFEYSVLQGANLALSNKRIDIIQLEINNTISNSGKRINDLLELIRQYQYRLCCYDVNAGQLKPVDYSAAKENYFAAHDLDDVNLKLERATSGR